MKTEREIFVTLQLHVSFGSLVSDIEEKEKGFFLVFTTRFNFVFLILETFTCFMFYLKIGSTFDFIGTAAAAAG